MSTDPFVLLCQAAKEQHDNELGEFIEKEGYSALRQLIYSLREKIKTYADNEIDEVDKLLECARHIIPEPGKFSPSWRHIWDEFRAMTAGKNKVLQTIPEQDREGEWQVVMHNPTLVEDVACYPGLSFLEAAFLYGYFQPELDKNEYIRLQKVTTLIMDIGQ